MHSIRNPYIPKMTPAPCNQGLSMACTSCCQLRCGYRCTETSRGDEILYSCAESAHYISSRPAHLCLALQSQGFLGSCRKGGLVVAIVRGHGDDAAYSRLRAGYDSGDAELLQTFDNLAKDHLKVYAGRQSGGLALLMRCHRL